MNKTQDADRHVIEPPAMWEKYVPKDIFEQVSFNAIHEGTNTVLKRIEQFGLDGAIQCQPILQLKGKALLNHWGDRIRIEAAKKGAELGDEIDKGADPELQIEAMNETGINIANLFPTFGGFVINNQYLTPEESVAFAKGYNQWLYDYCAYDRERLRGVGLISRHAPKAMLEQLQMIIDFGWTTVTLRPEMILGRVVGHPDYEDFWNACEKHSIAIAFHGGTHLQAPTIGSDRFTTHFALHACAHPMEIQAAFLSLLESGVLERHPQLKFAFLEAGASWIPHWLWRLDEICYADMPGEVAEQVKMKPSEYFKRQCWVGFEIGEPSLREVVDMIGIDKLLYGSDFPHPDHLQFDVRDIRANASNNLVKTSFEK